MHYNDRIQCIVKKRQQVKVKPIAVLRKILKLFKAFQLHKLTWVLLQFRYQAAEHVSFLFKNSGFNQKFTLLQVSHRQSFHEKLHLLLDPVFLKVFLEI